jgi:hypothetical protein
MTETHTDVKNELETHSDDHSSHTHKQAIKKPGMPWWAWVLIVVAVLFVIVPPIMGAIFGGIVFNKLKQEGFDVGKITKDAQMKGGTSEDKSKAMAEGIIGAIEDRVKQEAAKEGKNIDVDFGGMMKGDVKIPDGFPQDIILPNDSSLKLIIALKNQDKKTGKDEFTLSYAGEKVAIEKLYESFSQNLKANGWTIKDEANFGALNSINAEKDTRKTLLMVVGGSSEKGSGYVVNIAVQQK